MDLKGSILKNEVEKRLILSLLRSKMFTLNMIFIKLMRYMY